MKTLRFILILAGLSLAVPAQASPPPAPPVVTENSTNLLFYFWGYLEAQEEIADMEESGIDHPPIWMIANNARTLTNLFRDFPPFYSYLVGRADALAHEATKRGL